MSGDGASSMPTAGGLPPPEEVSALCQGVTSYHHSLVSMKVGYAPFHYQYTISLVPYRMQRQSAKEDLYGLLFNGMARTDNTPSTSDESKSAGTGHTLLQGAALIKRVYQMGPSLCAPGQKWTMEAAKFVVLALRSFMRRLITGAVRAAAHQQMVTARRSAARGWVPRRVDCPRLRLCTAAQRHRRVSDYVGGLVRHEAQLMGNVRLKLPSTASGAGGAGAGKAERVAVADASRMSGLHRLPLEDTLRVIHRTAPYVGMVAAPGLFPPVDEMRYFGEDTQLDGALMRRRRDLSGPAPDTATSHRPRARPHHKITASAVSHLLGGDSSSDLSSSSSDDDDLMALVARARRRSAKSAAGGGTGGGSAGGKRGDDVDDDMGSNDTANTAAPMDTAADNDTSASTRTGTTRGLPPPPTTLHVHREHLLAYLRAHPLYRFSSVCAAGGDLLTMWQRQMQAKREKERAARRENTAVTASATSPTSPPRPVKRQRVRTETKSTGGTPRSNVRQPATQRPASADNSGTRVSAAVPVAGAMGRQPAQNAAGATPVVSSISTAQRPVPAAVTPQAPVYGTGVTHGGASGLISSQGVIPQSHPAVVLQRAPVVHQNPLMVPQNPRMVGQNQAVVHPNATMLQNPPIVQQNQPVVRQNPPVVHSNAYVVHPRVGGPTMSDSEAQRLVVDSAIGMVVGNMRLQQSGNPMNQQK